MGYSVWNKYFLFLSKLSICIWLFFTQNYFGSRVFISKIKYYKTKYIRNRHCPLERAHSFPRIWRRRSPRRATHSTNRSGSRPFCQSILLAPYLAPAQGIKLDDVNYYWYKELIKFKKCLSKILRRWGVSYLLKKVEYPRREQKLTKEQITSIRNHFLCRLKKYLIHLLL